jgi:hypothetical protein
LTKQENDKQIELMDDVIELRQEVSPTQAVNGSEGINADLKKNIRTVAVDIGQLQAIQGRQTLFLYVVISLLGWLLIKTL